MKISKPIFYCLILFSQLLFLSQASATEGYVGSKQCIECHETEYKQWQGSHHDMAMRHAKEDSVLGNFDNFTFKFAGEDYRFYRKGAAYWVNIKGPDGKFKDYEIKYTFGFEPLQQYMVEFEDGRVQLIPFAWNSRTKANGGQRWFHLYPEFTQNTDEFFWTNTGQNWNYMCADCHSTNLKKGYDTATNQYKTTWSEINVACEACHGPAQNHIDWTKSPNNDRGSKGFDRNLAKAVAEWKSTPGSGTLSPVSIADTQQVTMCAQCHSRHTQISENDHVKSGEFGDRYLLNLIDSRLYHADGQIYDEDYVYGSFLQSKMAASGVVCTNCHEPHSAKLVIPKEAVCLQCHQADTYNTTEHHKHPMESEGAQCVNCHMPETTYMQVDPRRDHRWHIPRAGLEHNIGSPDVCLGCHQDKDQAWSKATNEKWFGKPNKDDYGFAPIFYAADIGYQNLGEQLSHIAQNYQHSNIIRASALMRLEDHFGTNAMIAIARSVKHEDSLIRLGAIYGARGLPEKEQWQAVSILLQDKVLAVRVEAASLLVRQWANLSAEQKNILKPALAEYVDVQQFNADRGASHVNLGNIYLYQSQIEKAEQSFLKAIDIEPYFPASYLNLAELYRRQGDQAKTISTLNQGLSAQPKDGDIPFSLGLAYIRSRDTEKALPVLKKATELASTNGYYKYVYAIALEPSSPKGAVKALKEAYQVEQNPRYFYSLCEMQLKHQMFGANQCLKQLKPMIPDANYQQLIQTYKGN